MSYRKEKIMSLTGQEVNGLNQSELKEQCETYLNAKMHGICFSPYEGAQEPGDPISEAQIRRKLELLVPYTDWIRVFSCTQGNEIIPKLAKEYGFRTLVGAWLGEEKETNDEELQGLIALASAGYVDVAAVGNEVMYREELEEEELIDYILQAKQALNGIPVGYVDAYYEFTNRPNITAACDVILANCYPYWEACHIDYSLLYMKQMYYQAVQAAPGKRVIITETGWPSSGDALGAAEPGYENALKYFINAQDWSQREGIEMFYFSAFDEGWKVGAEGSVGAFWGLWDANEQRKF
jgi:exo-beta-1,3-glucanase (GH17 family)